MQDHSTLHFYIDLMIQFHGATKMFWRVNQCRKMSQQNAWALQPDDGHNCLMLLRILIELHQTLYSHLLSGKFRE